MYVSIKIFDNMKNSPFKEKVECGVILWRVADLKKL